MWVQTSVRFLDLVMSRLINKHHKHKPTGTNQQIKFLDINKSMSVSFLDLVMSLCQEPQV